MYINMRHESDFINKTNERIAGAASGKTSLEKTSGRANCTHFGSKTWPEVIRLYKENKKTNTSKS